MTPEQKTTFFPPRTPGKFRLKMPDGRYRDVGLSSVYAAAVFAPDKHVRSWFTHQLMQWVWHYD